MASQSLPNLQPLENSVSRLRIKAKAAVRNRDSLQDLADTADEGVQYFSQLYVNNKDLAQRHLYRLKRDLTEADDVAGCHNSRYRIFGILLQDSREVLRMRKRIEDHIMEILQECLQQSSRQRFSEDHRYNGAHVATNWQFHQNGNTFCLNNF
ncbi:hypothetical protein D9758_010773 [Tetrapyrgos nigripes]|uniref:Uncharacterized protein n=1 Tax=Tetrapyrgos nigripes TaxID=182062 RepID=A0A8H5FYY8_9AGAR|nr:hypothetical protein D9758_010773 [Tetrapyrgos nigripes]